MISHHPDEEMLVDFASGSLSAPETLVVSGHVAMCARCRRHVEQLETLGAALLEDGATAPVDDGAFGAIMSKIETGSIDDETVAVSRLDPDTRAVVPPPLRGLLPASLAALRWRRSARGIEEAVLPSYGGARISLLRIRAGLRVPAHTHAGSEYTLVLSGGFSDAGQHYAPGDMAVADDTVDHAPVADRGEPCLCLTVRCGATRLTGPVGRLFNPLVRRIA